MNQVESLSPRTLLDATLVGGILMVTGTAGNDRILVGAHVNGRISATIRNLDSSSSQTEALDAASVQGVSINGGDGFDIITMGPHLPAVTIYCDGGDDMIVGDSRANEPINGAGRNKLHGNAGNDSITGAALHDRIFGDDRRDTLVSGKGSNRLEGGAENDRLVLGSDLVVADTAFGGTGHDRAVDAGENDVLSSIEANSFMQ